MKITLGRIQKLVLEKAEKRLVPVWEIAKIYGSQAQAVSCVEILKGLGLLNEIKKFQGTYYAYNKETKTEWR